MIIPKYIKSLIFSKIKFVDKNRTDQYIEDGTIVCPYKSIQSAINSITDNSDANRYVIMIAPGKYTEQITVKSFVSLVGYAQNQIIIEYDGVVVIAPSAMDNFEGDIVNCIISGLDDSGNSEAISLQNDGCLGLYNVSIVNYGKGIICNGNAFLTCEGGGLLTNKDGVELKDTSFGNFFNYVFTSWGDPYYDLIIEASATAQYNVGCFFYNSRVNNSGTILYAGVGADGSFTTSDSKTVTVAKGIITSIVG